MFLHGCPWYSLRSAIHKNPFARSRLEEAKQLADRLIRIDRGRLQPASILLRDWGLVVGEAAAILH